MILEPASLDCCLQGSKGLTKHCWVAVDVFRIIFFFFFRLFWAHVSDWRSLKAEGANPAWTSNKVKSFHFFLQFSHFLFFLISYSVFRIYFCISNVVNHISSYLWLHSLFFFFMYSKILCIVFFPYFFLFSAHIVDCGAQKANPAWTFNKVNSVSSAKVKHISSVKLSTFCLSCGYFGEISLFSFPACWLCWPFLIWEWERTMQYI